LTARVTQWTDGPEENGPKEARYLRRNLEERHRLNKKAHQAWGKLELLKEIMLTRGNPAAEEESIAAPLFMAKT